MKLGGGNSNIFGSFTRNLGKMNPIWRSHIFQMGWFNHQRSEAKRFHKPLLHPEEFFMQQSFASMPNPSGAVVKTQFVVRKKKSPTQVSNEKKTLGLFRVNVGDDSSYPVMCGILTISSGSLYKTTRIGIPWDENHRGMHHLSQIQVASPQNRHRTKTGPRTQRGKEQEPLCHHFSGGFSKVGWFLPILTWKMVVFFRFSIQFSNGWVVNFLLPRYFLGKTLKRFFQ